MATSPQSCNGSVLSSSGVKPTYTLSLQSYNAFVRRNAFWITPIEDFCRAATVFLPGRFSSEDLKGEGVYTAVNLISLYHDHILGRNRPQLSIKCIKENTYTRNLKLALSMLRNVQVISEMFAVKYFPHRRWHLVLGIELVKTYIQFALLYHNQGRMLISQSAEQSTITFEKKKVHKLRKKLDKENKNLTELEKMYILSGRSVSNAHGLFSEYKNPAKVKTNSASEQSFRQLPNGREKIAEFLHTIRPVVYVCGRMLFQDNRNSWNPWLLSLAVDIFSRVVRRRTASADLGAEQQGELRRRNLLLLFYLLRDPFWQYTKTPLVSVATPFTRIPVIGVLFSNALKLALFLQRYHFYTSAS